MGAQEDDKSSIIDDPNSTTNGVGAGGATDLPAIQILTLLEKAKFYTSLFLGTMAILAVFGFLFLIPFVVEPAITTILADFSPHPVACVVSEHVYAEGLKNCSWASCREGCTSAATRCHQLRVNYSRMPYDEFITKPLGSVAWDVTDTKFYINTEGCGYPPRVNCSVFAKEFGRSNMGKIIPCFYSRTYPGTVVSRYSWNQNLRHLVLAIVIPILIFVISLAVLFYWHCTPMKSCGGPGRNLIDKYSRKEDCTPLLQHSSGRRIRGRRRGVLIVTEGSPPSAGVTQSDNSNKSNDNNKNNKYQINNSDFKRSQSNLFKIDLSNWPIIANYQSIRV
ncbi:tipE homolog 2 phospholipid transfer protein [Cotesia typhae]|uniref:tipE homolog 2 phospholipid transfer protein n=1 Tax=Cotesia typhae TaxID=2053667 RepID=UPI003D699504